MQNSRMPKRVKKVMYIEATQSDSLRLISEKTRIPQSALVREALDLLFRLYKKHLSLKR